MPPRPRLERSALFLVALTLAGCAASATPTPSPATAPPATVSSPTPVVVLPLDLCANTGADCDLAAGQYVAQQFQPVLGFTLDAGWTNTAYVERAIQLLRGDTASLSIVSGELDGPTASAPVLASGSDAPTPAAGATAADFLAYLHTLAGITASAPVPATLGGLAGSQVDVHVGKANVTLFNQPLTSATEDAFDLRAGETARLWAVDVAGARVVFIAETFGSASLGDFETTEAAPLLASLTFPAGP